MNKIKTKNNNKFLSGYTLSEVIIAITIFVFIMGSIITFFGDFVTNYNQGKNLQQNLEEAQQAFNLMSKTFRTSSIIDNSNPEKIRIYDYSQKTCIEYEFDSTNNQLVYYKYGDNENTITWNNCDSLDLSSHKIGTISENISSLNFESVASNSGTDTVGKITILAKFERRDDDFYIQTTISLRDYGESDIL